MSRETAGGGGADFGAWVPELEAELRRLGTLQLEAMRALGSADVRWKTESEGEPSIVTRWDVESESRLRDFVSRAWPSHSFLGEEQGDDRRDPAHYWLCDPIDGTANFVDGIPYWGTSLAYWSDGAVRLGIVTFPALDRTYTAIAGSGAFVNGIRFHTPTVDAYSMRGCVALDSRMHLRSVLRLRTRVRILGSAIANLCLTASGTFQASVTRAKLWDLAAGELLLREAGAAVESDPDLATLAPSSYDAHGPRSRITLYARASRELPSLRTFLHPATPD